MCKYAYEKYVMKSKREMIFCKLKDNETDDLAKLCIAQRYCDEKDKYIPHKQKERCKYYE